MIQPEIPEVELVVKGYPELVGLLLLILQHHGLLLLPQRLQLFAQHLAHIKILPRVYKYTIFKPQRAILSASSLTHSALHILSTSKGPSLLQHNLANKRVEQIHIGYCFAHLCLLTACSCDSQNLFLFYLEKTMDSLWVLGHPDLLDVGSVVWISCNCKRKCRYQ